VRAGALAVAATLLASGLGLAEAQSSADLTLSLTVHGRTRVAYVHVPPRLDPAVPAAVVLGYHGGAGTAQGYIRHSQLFVKGERGGVVVVCPEGTLLPGSGEHRVWNSGPEYARAARDADDVAFTAALIDEIARRYPIDGKRVYATGFSNGGQMAYRLALELASRIAAIAPMSGGRLVDGPPSARAVPVLHIHGTADSLYPLAGGLGSHSIGRTPHVAILPMIADWAARNGDAAVAQVEAHSGWTRQAYVGPAPIELVLVEGLGHQIAGGEDDRLPGQALRDQPDAVALALEFFRAHPMR